MAATKSAVFTTTVDQTIGTHQPTGLTETRLVDVTTEWPGLEEVWDDMDDAGRAERTEDVRRLHAAEVRLAEQSPAVRALVEEWLATADGTDDLDCAADVLDQLIDDAAAECED